MTNLLDYMGQTIDEMAILRVIPNCGRYCRTVSKARWDSCARLDGNPPVLFIQMFCSVDVEMHIIHIWMDLHVPAF